MIASQIASCPPEFRFTGHETFPLRYAWLSKATTLLGEPTVDFRNDEAAMVELGLGKNMVRALRFWVQATGVANSQHGQFMVTPFGHDVLGKKGFDPFLEDIRTLWLLHWKLSTHVDEPLFAWDFLLNRWQQDIVRSRAVEAFQQEAESMQRRLSKVTIEQHFDIFLHTYVPTRGKKGVVLEENLDSPFTQLNLIQEAGSPIPGEVGKREIAYSFRREEKREITPALFIFCLNDFWSRRHRGEKSMTFQKVAIGHGGPGQIYKLPEADIRSRLEAIQDDSGGHFYFEETAAHQSVFRPQELDAKKLLEKVYEQDFA